MIIVNFVNHLYFSHNVLSLPYSSFNLLSLNACHSLKMPVFSYTYLQHSIQHSKWWNTEVGNVLCQDGLGSSMITNNQQVLRLKTTKFISHCYRISISTVLGALSHVVLTYGPKLTGQSPSRNGWPPWQRERVVNHALVPNTSAQRWC